MAERFVTYYRLSRESRSGGLGLDAQKEAVSRFLRSIEGEVIQEFTEIESGKRVDRVELGLAIALCKRSKSRLCIAKLDRLARNAAFLLTLRDSGIEFVAADMPTADKLTVGILAVFAEHERDMISARTKAALAEAKKRGVKLGCPVAKEASILGSNANILRADRFAQNVMPIIHDIRRAGINTLQGVADALNARGIRSPLNRTFSRQTVSNLISRSAN